MNFLLMASETVHVSSWFENTQVLAATGSSLVRSSDAMLAAGIGLGFGLVVIALVLGFIAYDRQGTHRLEQGLIESATNVDEHADAALQSTGPILGAPPPPPISGPSRVLVGKTADYAYQNLPEGAGITWLVSGPATIPKGTTTPAVTVTATGPGEIELTARVTGDQPDTVSRTIQAFTGELAAVRLSILGEGYGTVVIALAVASVTVSLGLTDVLNGEAVAGILGSLVTYSVVRGTSIGGGSGQGAAAEGQRSGGSR